MSCITGWVIDLRGARGIVCPVCDRQKADGGRNGCDESHGNHTMMHACNEID